MLDRQFTHCMLRPDDLEPSDERMKVVGTFNPGITQLGDQTVLMVRVVEAPIESRRGFLCSPRLHPQHGLVLDWFPAEEHDATDPRVYTHRIHGTIRLKFLSHLRVFRSSDGKTLDSLEGKVIEPQGEYETYGIEDPRITQIGDTFYIAYVCVSHHGVATALMSTKDFESYQRHGVIFCPDNKDVLLFPEKLDGQYVAMHRPMPMMKFTTPQIWIARSPDLLHWGHHEQLIGNGSQWMRDRAGGGTPPIKTEQGWLTVYHGSNKLPGQGGAGVYTAGLMLLDKKNPSKIVGRSSEPIMEPQAEFEKRGFLDTVVFPTGLLERDNIYYVYYGAADDAVGVAGFKREDFFDALG